MQVVRRASFTASPWKNGGGITHEAIRVPPHGDPFLWRVSVAQIDLSGPFSDFAGYDRKMVLLHGSGLELTFDAAAAVSLTSPGEMAEFDGALKAHCRLLDGPCTDLNLMVARSLGPVGAGILRVDGRRPLPPYRGVSLVFSISGGLWVEDGVGRSERLYPWDLAVLPAGGAAAVASDPGQGSSSLVFLATLDDNPR
jgi:environmental stress-induced protein Ves